MGFWDKIGFGRNKITDPEFSHNPMWESIGSNEATYLDMNDLMKVYHTIPHVKMAINALASMTSNGIYKVVDSEGEEVLNHPLTNLLENPNFIQQRKQFVFNQTVNKHVYGNAYLLMNRQTFGVSSMFVLPTEDVKIEYNGKLYEQTSLNGIIKSIEINNEKYDVDDIIFLKENDDRLIVGESKLLTLKQQISNIKHAYDARNVNITQRGATGILSVGQTMTKDGVMMNPMTPMEKKQAEENLQNNYGLGRGKSRTLVTSLNANFTPMSFPTKDLMLFEEIEDDKSVILDTFGIDDNMFSKTKASTFNNKEIGERKTYENTIIPNAQIDSTQIGKQSGMLEDGQSLMMDFSHLAVLKDDQKLKSEILKNQLDSLEKALSMNLIDENEAKQLYDEKIKF